jgi:hypothetical protein
VRNTLNSVIALFTGLAWPAVVGVIAWWYRDSLSKFIAELPRNIKSFKVAGVEIQLEEAKSVPLSIGGGAVDLRHAGRASDVNDSTQASFFRQIQDPTRTDYVVVDLGVGSEWLSSRLYILSVILRRMRGLRAIVFVQTDGTMRRKFIGVCECEATRWRLAEKWPRFESALAAAELNVWGHPYDVPGTIIVGVPPGQVQIPGFVENGPIRISNEEGRLVGWGDSPEPAANLLRSFLNAIQRPAPIPIPSDDWQELETTPKVAEYAVWLTGSLVDQVLVDSLEKRSVRLQDYQGWSDQVRIRAFVEHSGDWVAVTREGGAFDRLINRSEIVERMATQAGKAANG